MFNGSYVSVSILRLGTSRFCQLDYIVQGFSEASMRSYFQTCKESKDIIISVASVMGCAELLDTIILANYIVGIVFYVGIFSTTAL